MFKPGVTFLFAVLLIGSLLSCAQKQDVAGKWQEVGKKSTIEFHTDSTFKAVDDMGMAVSGKYTLQENGSIRFEITHDGSAPEIVEGKLSKRGDELTFSSADDKKFERYKKVKFIQQGISECGVCKYQPHLTSCLKLPVFSPVSAFMQYTLLS